MVAIEFEPHFRGLYSKLKDNNLKEKVKKQIYKIRENLEIGKPMRFARKGTREVYISPYRLSYIYISEDGKIVFLDLYHKNEQ